MLGACKWKAIKMLFQFLNGSINAIADFPIEVVQRSFNSSMVQLMLIGLYMVNLQLQSFNSSMVQLMLDEFDNVYVSFSFQFLNGSINANSNFKFITFILVSIPQWFN